MNEIIGMTKMLCALVEHSSEWIVTRIAQQDVQAFLGTILRLTGWSEAAGVDENISEVRNSIVEEADQRSLLSQHIP